MSTARFSHVLLPSRLLHAGKESEQVLCWLQVREALLHALRDTELRARCGSFSTPSGRIEPLLQACMQTLHGLDPGFPAHDQPRIWLEHRPRQ
jgi:hypothetical protein